MRKRNFRLQLIAVLAGLIFGLVSTMPVDAKVSPFRSATAFGPYEAGFETVELYDYSRVYRDRYDYDGNPRAGETARPIQICIWYPAVKIASGHRMVYGEYAFPAPADSRFYPFVSALQGREVGFLGRIFGGRVMLVQDMSNLPVTAMKNAPRAEGSFPLIIYHPGTSASFAENAAMCESLASNGFIVAASHSAGAMNVAVATDEIDLETMVRDREFVYGFMRDYPNSDYSRVGLLGTGTGGMTALLMQMRNPCIEAVATLDGDHCYSGGSKFACDFPLYDAARMDVPLLQTHITGHDSVNTSIFDSLIHSRRIALGFAGRDRIDFTQYAVATALLTDTTGEQLEPALNFYDGLCVAVLDFFEINLKDKDPDSTIFANLSADNYPQFGNVTADIRERQTPPPTEAQFVELIQDNRIGRAVEIYEVFKKSRPGYVFFHEATMNAVGYRLLQANQIEQAQMIFKMNAEAFPNSANVWDSYADGCLAGGDTPTAILCYQRVLEVLPNDSAVGEDMREMLLNNATQALEQLQK